jgi:AcrR family transcriptional regulator
MSSSSYPDLGRVRAPRQERSRRAFAAALAAFEELLRERALGSVTMQEVADRAGLSITSVYARFDGKAALVLALHEHVIAQGLAALEAALDDGELAGAPLESVVAAIVEGAVEFAHEHAHVFRAVLAAGDEETNERAAAFIRGGSERLARLLGPRIPSDPANAARDVDFAWRATVAVLQQSWMLHGAEPARFPLAPAALAQRLTSQFLAAVDPRRR